jgi:hypothetical protein
MSGWGLNLVVSGRSSVEKTLMVRSTRSLKLRVEFLSVFRAGFESLSLSVEEYLRPPGLHRRKSIQRPGPPGALTGPELEFDLSSLLSSGFQSQVHSHSKRCTSCFERS